MTSGGAPRRRRSTVGDLPLLLLKKAVVEESLAETAGRVPPPPPPQYTQGCVICKFTPGSSRRENYAQGVAKGEMHKLTELLAKEKKQRIEAQAKVAELEKELALVQHAMDDLRKASAGVERGILRGSDMAAQFAERERLLSMEFERQLERERQKKLEAKEELRQAEEAMRQAEALAADRLRALLAFQRQRQSGSEATNLREMHRAVSVLRKALVAMREHAVAEQTVRVAEGIAVRKSLHDLARAHAEREAQEAQEHRSVVAARDQAQAELRDALGRLKEYEARHAELHLGVTAARSEAVKARTDALDKGEKWARLKADLKARNTQCNELRDAESGYEAEKRQRAARALAEAEAAAATIAKLRAELMQLRKKLGARAEATEAGGGGPAMRERAEAAEAACAELQKELEQMRQDERERVRQTERVHRPDGCARCSGPDRSVLVVDRRELLNLAAAGRELYACCTLTKGGREQLDEFLTALAKCETRASGAKVKAVPPRMCNAVDDPASELPQLPSNAAATAWAAHLAQPTLQGMRTSRSARSTRQNILGQNPDSWGRAGVLSPPSACGPGPMGTPRSRRGSREREMSGGPWQGTFRPSWGAEAQL